MSQNDDENADLLPKKRFDAHVNSTLQCNQQRWRRRRVRGRVQVGGGSAAARGRERAGATGRRRARLPFSLRGQWCRGWFWLHTHTCADDSVGPLPSQATWAPCQIGVGDCTTYGRSLHRGSGPPLSPPSLSLALVMARDYGQIFAHRGPFSDRFSAGSVRKPSEEYCRARSHLIFKNL